MKNREILKRQITACLMASFLSIPAAGLAANAVVPNTTTPTGEHFLGGTVGVDRPADKNIVNVNQTSQNAAIRWDSFSVGANATVNFNGSQSGFNTLNYVNGGNMSQIYGTINANNNGNIYLVNPSGVQISNSAQINVGSLYVSNRNLSDEDLRGFAVNAHKADFSLGGIRTNAELMSLGNINADKVTFDGDRVVIDMDRLKYKDEENNTYEKLYEKKPNNIVIQASPDEGKVVLGYEAYKGNTYAGQNDGTVMAKVNGNDFTKADGYMWVENLTQLQDINTNLDGKYALRGGIDATATEADPTQFKPIGAIEDGQEFTGAFDGLGFNIFDLNIQSKADYVGLFGVTKDAHIRNVSLIGGAITGGNYAGSMIGMMKGGRIENVTNSAAVTGAFQVGGLVGQSSALVKSDGNVNPVMKSLVNTGTISGTMNVGGIAGRIENATLDGNTYNYAAVKGSSNNVGGIVGEATKSTIGNEGGTIQNRLNVQGKVNVGGIAGQIDGTTIQKAENHGTVTATGSKRGDYFFHTDYDDGKGTYVPGVHREDVNEANVGGIVGNSEKGSDGTVSQISDVLNTGDVSSFKETGNDYYNAGNVGGIVGRAEDTNITNATNKESDIRGAHNVGGIAGYFGGAGKITNGANDGGDIMATGARFGNDFVHEIIRSDYKPDVNSERYITGNIGGIVGYMYGDGVSIEGSFNRGSVHTFIPDIPATADLPDASKAANVGGIVGKVDRENTKDLSKINDKEKGAISGSSNSGDVRGFAAIGGIVGMMYNGEVTTSYNLGKITSTRTAAKETGVTIPINMGGIIGDSTENSAARVLLYDVYNKGVIGDNTYSFYGRHVGGIAGRLSGRLEKAYNTGDIYNGSNVVGGIAGYWVAGTISNVFNTGNVTVKNTNSKRSQMGGIVGAADLSAENLKLSNAYNLGTLRSFRGTMVNDKGDTVLTDANTVGGIVGYLIDWSTKAEHSLQIDHVYTTGNIYAAVAIQNADGTPTGAYKEDNDAFRGSILANHDLYTNGSPKQLVITNAYYIKPENENDFTVIGEGSNRELQNATDAIEYADRSNPGNYKGWNFSGQADGSGDVTGNSNDNWRIYPGNTPILNAFLPNAEGHFSDSANMDGIDSIQYGTAYDPLLTIIHANKNLSYDWKKDLGIRSDAGLAVYGAGLTLTNFQQIGSSMYGGLLYSDGALTITTAESSSHDNHIGLGKGSQLYGSSITIKADGKADLYGTIQATGNNEGTGDITIDAGEVNLYGTLTSAQSDEKVTIPGIGDRPQVISPGTTEQMNDPSQSLPSIGDRFARETNTASQHNGDITITGHADQGSGDVNLYFGNLQDGKTTAYGDLNVNGEGDVYMDSDLDLYGNLNITSPGEIVFDISNIGKVGAASEADAIKALHENFLGHFTQGGSQWIHFKNPTEGGKADVKITVDMWNSDTKKFDYTKYDLAGQDPGNFMRALQKVQATRDGTAVETDKINMVYLWVSDAEQLAAIQDSEANPAYDNPLGHNYALKNDIDASGIKDYVGIGTGQAGGYNGNFDGRGQSVIGLAVNGTGGADGHAGIFSEIGENSIVRNLNVVSGTFTGTDYAGAVAGINHGTIDNVIAFGNTVTANGSQYSESMQDTFDGNGNKNTTESIHVGAAGGIAGMNTAAINNVSNVGTVIAGDAKDGSGALSAAGGIVGINRGGNDGGKTGGNVENSSSNSAVTATADSTYGMGGIVGINMEHSNILNVDSAGVVRGIHEAINGTEVKSSYIGGIAGINDNATISEAYNESYITGNNYVGGIAGVNNASIGNVTNGGNINADIDTIPAPNPNPQPNDPAEFQYIGGLVGHHLSSGNTEDKLINGRNNGEIHGGKYVGGMVGLNGAGAKLENLVNDSSASIDGYTYVGGIAGRNEGEIKTQGKATNEDPQQDINLVNRGIITGNRYVGGVAGENLGTITNVNSDVVLNAKGDNAQFFGGIAGSNAAGGTIENATNRANISAADAKYVGGIVGQNDGILRGTGDNYGNVIGGSYVGGLVGLNTADIGDNKNASFANNMGTVTANKGGAGGLIGENRGDIINNTMSNTGEVSGASSETGDNSGTGGLMGVNSGTITGSTLTNEGTVTSSATGDNSGTGGLIGINTGTGNISTTSLKNKVKGDVSGVQNVGGLIGINTGTITGGRNEANTQYVYQIYNNGVITGTGTGSNIGGLIGNNAVDGNKKGTLTGGYNTGAIEAANSTNVGGIAGTNSGAIDQVFNTVYTSNGNTGAVTGKTNVGGLVGNNAAGGAITNGYNTTGVKGSADTKGDIAGNNAGTVSEVYGNNQLIGTGNKAVHGYVVDSSDTWKDKGAYEGFDISDAAKDSTTWRIYAGHGNPLLKLFLTTASYNGDKDFTYNGQVQGPDKDKVNAADKLSAYEQAKILLHFLENQKDAGHYTITSEQIAKSDAGDFNPNNLGYDIDLNYTINKATLNVLLDAISREYGKPNITNGTKGDYGYNFGDMKLTDEMKAELVGNLGFVVGTDHALDGTGGDRKTNNARDDYTWSANFSLSDALKKNYQFDGTGAATLNLNNGKSVVKKAQLTINLGDIDRIYGNTDIINGGKYGVKDDTLVNGDTGLTVNGNAAKNDGGLVDNENKTNDQGKYKWSVSDAASNFGGVENLENNYTIVKVNAGNSNVAAKEISVKDILATIMYGKQDGKDFQVSNWGTVVGTVYGDKVTAMGSGADMVIGSDYDKNANGRPTADVGSYKNSIRVSGLKLSGDKAKNYTLASDSAMGNINVTKAQLTINLGDIDRIYGNTDIINGGKYGVKDDTLVNGDTGLTVNGNAAKNDGGLVDNGKKTNDQGKYKWSVSDAASNFGGVANLENNYTIVKVNAGNSNVAAKEISVGDILATIMYGRQDGNDFQLTHPGTLNGLVYDDNVTMSSGKASVVDDSDYAKDRGNRKTANVGTYESSIRLDGLTLQGDKAKNYVLADTSALGSIQVTPAKLGIHPNDVTVQTGQEPNYTGSVPGFVNGDSFDVTYGVSANDGTKYQVEGVYKNIIGFWIGGDFYGQGSDMSKLFGENYTIDFKPGTLTVEPDGTDGHWDYLYKDNPFDKEWNERERKAELYFIDAGMKL